MTDEEIKLDHSEALRALHDPTHQWHQGVVILLDSYEHGAPHLRDFIRKIAPYLFDSDGKLISRNIKENAIPHPQDTDH